MKFEFVPRESWGAKYGRGAATSGAKPLVIIHHAAEPDIPLDASTAREIAAVRSIENFHVKANGWNGIAYNWLVFQSGNIYEGRGWNRVGAHTEGQNSKSVGICFVINGDAHGADDNAWNAARRIIDEGVHLGSIASDYAIKGHHDYAVKSCPGAHVYPLLKEKLGARPLLKLGSRGPAVVELQKKLGIGADGIFGPMTEFRVIQVQRKAGLFGDGVVGAKTWTLLFK